jgi:release factor glutamine methyltransferase
MSKENIASSGLSEPVEVGQVDETGVTAFHRHMHEAFRATDSGTEVEYLGKMFIVNTNVFWPGEDSKALAMNYVVHSGDEVLDLCTGAGPLAVLSAYKGAQSVLAVDLNPDAVENARTNAERHGFAHIIEARESDMFSAVETGRKFDVITMNPPFIDHPADDIVSRSTWDEALHVHKEFFASAPDRLKAHGRSYIAEANYGTIREMQRLAGSAGFAVQEIGRHKKPYTDLVFYAYELRLT